MAERQIYYMDIIADARAVMGIVIIAEDTQLFQLATCVM